MADALLERLRGILHSLPLRDGKADRVDFHAGILAGAAYFRGVKKDQFRFESIGKRAARKYLRDLVNLTVKMHKHLDLMPLEVWEASVPLTPSAVHAYKKEVAGIGNSACETFKALGRDPLPGRRGRRREFLPNYVAKLAAKAWEDLTGKSAAPGYRDIDEVRSPFEQFLGDVFSALGIEANAEHYSKSLARSRREQLQTH